jgi:hypothetical protein
MCSSNCIIQWTFKQFTLKSLHKCFETREWHILLRFEVKLALKNHHSLYFHHGANVMEMYIDTSPRTYAFTSLYIITLPFARNEILSLLKHPLDSINWDYKQTTSSQPQMHNEKIRWNQEPILRHRNASVVIGKSVFSKHKATRGIVHFYCANVVTHDRRIKSRPLL